MIHKSGAPIRRGRTSRRDRVRDPRNRINRSAFKKPSQRSYQSWNINKVQSGFRWSRTPALCSPIRRSTSTGSNRPCRSRRDRLSNEPGRPARARATTATGIPKPSLRTVRGSTAGAGRRPLFSRGVWFGSCRTCTGGGERLHRVDKPRVEKRAHALPGRRPCLPGRPWREYRQGGMCPDSSASDRVSGSAVGTRPPARTQVFRFDVDRRAPATSNRSISAPEYEPSQQPMGERDRFGSPLREIA